MTATAPLLTVREVAETLRLSPETILRYVRSGRLPAIKLPGGAVRIRADQLEDWLDSWATPGRGSANHPALDAAQPQAYWSNPGQSGLLGLVVPTTPKDEEK